MCSIRARLKILHRDDFIAKDKPQVDLMICEVHEFDKLDNELIATNYRVQILKNVCVCTC